MAEKLTAEQIISKRNYWPVNIGGDVVHIRGLLPREQKTSKTMEETHPDEAYGYLIGKSLVRDNGERVFMQETNEDDLDFARRVNELEIPYDTRSVLTIAIISLSNGPTKEQIAALKKRSSTPTTQ